MHKFGGASLANAELYRTCGDILIEESKAGGKQTPTAAVVSAMKGYTDKLIAVVETAAKPDGEAEAKKLLDDVVNGQIATARDLLDGRPDLADEVAKSVEADAQDIGAMLRSLSMLRVAPNSTMEFVAGQGEIWSAQILCAYLKMKGVPTAWLNARHTLVVEAGSASQGVGAKGAALDMKVEPMYGETATRLQAWWEDASKDFPTDQPPVVVMAGFVACTVDGVPTTLKRSGSDYSATIFAKLLKASQVTLWKNVDGVFTCDPGIVPEARTIKKMSYDEAIELAYFGGQVLHPTAMGPAMADDTPVFVRNVFNPSFDGTEITKEGSMIVHSAIDPDLECEFDGPVKFITSIANIAMVNVKGGAWGSVSKMTRRAMGAMEDAGVKVQMLTQADATHSVTLAIDESESKRALKALEEAFELELSRGSIEGIDQDTGYSMLAVIGDDMRGKMGTLSKLSAALARAGINIVSVAQGSAERNLTIVLEKPKLKLAMAAIHDEFKGSSQSLTSSVADVIRTNWESNSRGPGNMRI
jgi:aspartokinase/homoserine dehydrogenase 1